MRTHCSIIRLVVVAGLALNASALPQHQHVGFQQLFLGDTTSRSPPAMSTRKKGNREKHFGGISHKNNSNNNNNNTTTDNNNNKSSSINKEKALQELKDRAQFTAKMETSKTIIDKIVQTLFQKKKPRTTATAAMVNKNTRSKTTKLLTKSSSKPPPKIWTSTTTAMANAVTRTATTTKGSVGHPSKISLKSTTRTTLPQRRSLNFTKLKRTSLRKKKQFSRMWTKRHLGTITPHRYPSPKSTSKWVHHVVGAAATRSSSTRGTTAQLVRQTAMRQSRRRGKATWKIATRRKILVRRVSRTLPLALPVVGGIFGLLAFQADYIRCQEEWDRRQQLLLLRQQLDTNSSPSQPQQQRGITKRRTRSSQTTQMNMIANAMMAFFLFLMAAVADYIDTLCQFLMAHTLFWHHGSVGSMATTAAAASTPPFMTIENISMVCAMVSTICAVVGELYSQQYRHEKEFPSNVKNNERRE